MKRTLTPEQQQRREARYQLARDIAAMTEEQRASLAARSSIATIEGRTLSPFNACMVASQCPNATIVGGFRQWLAAGRCVRKGEHGFAIWCPTSKKTEDDSEETAVRFVLGTVFDVSQTDEITDQQQPKQYAPRPTFSRDRDITIGAKS